MVAAYSVDDILFSSLVFFFFNDTATTEIYTLSLHDALPICRSKPIRRPSRYSATPPTSWRRSEEHTSELQSLAYLVCRLLLEKKQNTEHNCTVLQTDGGAWVRTPASGRP